MTNWSFRSTVAAALVGVLASAGPAVAGPIDVSLPANFFGHLDMRTTQCPSLGCGPAAAVNGFVWLQTNAPDIYGSALIEPGETLASVADKLLGRSYMNTAPPIGTLLTDFARGKRRYIEERVEGKTIYQAQVRRWPQSEPRPDWVDVTVPELEFIERQLLGEEAVELLLTFTDPGIVRGHYVTVTGLTWTPNLNEGLLTFVDPADGATRSAVFMGVGHGEFTVSYETTDGALRFARIEAVISQSPRHIPEPATLLLIGSGLTLALRRRRHYRYRALRAHEP